MEPTVHLVEVHLVGLKVSERRIVGQYAYCPAHLSSMNTVRSARKYAYWRNSVWSMTDLLRLNFTIWCFVGPLRYVISWVDVTNKHDAILSPLYHYRCSRFGTLRHQVTDTSVTSRCNHQTPQDSPSIGCLQTQPIILKSGPTTNWGKANTRRLPKARRYVSQSWRVSKGFST